MKIFELDLNRKNGKDSRRFLVLTGIFEWNLIKKGNLELISTFL
jgi:hypothetical protein